MTEEDRLRKIEMSYHEISGELKVVATEMKHAANALQQVPDLLRVRDRVEHIETELEDTVKQLEFKPIRLFVYGLIGLVLSSVGAAVITLILK